MRTAKKQTSAFPGWIILVLIVLAMTSLSRAQDKDGTVIPDFAPHPYLSAGLSLMPNGYAHVAYRLEGGVMENYKHLVFNAYGAYDNGKKTNDGTENNIAGHDRYLRGFLAWRPKTNTYYGFGGLWNQLVTTNYTKGTNFFQAVRDGDFRVQAVAGHDWISPHFSMTGEMHYIFAPFHESVAYPATPTSPGYVCSGCGNGVQGPEFDIYFPSIKPGQCRIHLPGGCLLFEETLGIYEFHDTYTIPGGYPGERGRHAMATTSFKLIYRF